MDTPAYIAKNLDELFDKAAPEIQDIIASGEIDSAAKELVTTYGLEDEKQVPLSNVISFTLIGAIEPKDVVLAPQDVVGFSKDDAIVVTRDLNNSIFKKAKLATPLVSKDEVKTLDFTGVASASQLREQILEKTKRESGLVKNQASPKQEGDKKLVVLKPGSRTQLLEQLQVIGTIPNEDEISVRLAHIQEQISLMKKEEEDTSLESKIALKSFMFGEKGKAVADAAVNRATYSVPPTKYNVDPYRETAAEDQMLFSTHGGA